MVQMTMKLRDVRPLLIIFLSAVIKLPGWCLPEAIGTVFNSMNIRTELPERDSPEMTEPAKIEL